MLLDWQELLFQTVVFSVRERKRRIEARVLRSLGDGAVI